MDHVLDEISESRVRMEAATDLLDLASSRLNDAITSGSKEAIEEARLALRLARRRFLKARAEYREIASAHLPVL